MPPPHADDVALSLVNVSMTFGRVRVLDGVGLELRAGEIHGLVGQNGSGKSTLIKLLSGLYRADAGSHVLIGGRRLDLPLGAAQLDQLGIAFVHQDLGLVDTASVVDNVRIGRFARGRISRRVRTAVEREAVARTLARLGSTIDPSALVGSLPPADRAIVAIARALQSRSAGAGIVVFDESTQSLPREVLSGFYATVRDLAASGTAVLLVSHQLDEVIELADRVTVLKDGVAVARALPTAQTSRRDLTRLMLGADADTAALHDEVTTMPGDIALRAEHVTTADLHGLDLELRAGEVLGVTGTTGSGHDDLPYVLAGAHPAGARLTVGGRTVQLDRVGPRDLLAEGVCLVPQGRATAGLALQQSVQDNLCLPRLRGRSGRWRLTRGWQQEEFRWVADNLGLTPRRPELPAAALSGGNQQKLLIGKWLVASPKVLILHEVTQAVDVGARREILRAVRAAARSGVAVLLVSIDAEDLATACDRVLVLDHGRVAAELVGPLTPDDVLAAVFHGEPKTVGTGVHT